MKERKKPSGVFHDAPASPVSSRGTSMSAYLVYVSGDVFVLDDDEQAALGVLLPQEGHGALVHVALLQQVLLQAEAQMFRLLRCVRPPRCIRFYAMSQ